MPERRGVLLVPAVPVLLAHRQVQWPRIVHSNRVRSLPLSVAASLISCRCAVPALATRASPGPIARSARSIDGGPRVCVSPTISSFCIHVLPVQPALVALRRLATSTAPAIRPLLAPAHAPASCRTGEMAASVSGADGRNKCLTLCAVACVQRPASRGSIRTTGRGRAAESL